MQGRPKYSGEWNEDILEVIEVYEVTCAMVGVSEAMKREGIPIMLASTALTHYTTHLKDKETYQEVIDGLKAWFTSEEQRSRLLREWQNTRLSTWMQRNREKSQSEVFRNLSAHLAKVQRQLHADYKPDRFLKDQLVLSADIPSVSRALKEKPPTTSHEATQRIAALLSDEPASATFNDSHADDPDINYMLGKKFAGDAEKNFRKTRKKKNEDTYTRQDRSNLSKVKGCWVCGKDHVARKFHSAQEVSNAVERLKRSKAYVSIADAVSVFNAQVESSDSSDTDNFEDDDEDNEGNVVMLEEIDEINKELEKDLSNKSFNYSYTFAQHRKDEMKKMNRELKFEDSMDPFKGIMIDSGKNYLSLISLEQYQAYCQKFSIPAVIRKYAPKRIKGIGGSQSCFGSVTIPIAFNNIGVVIDVDFNITRAPTLTIFCLRDLKSTGFQLDIQEDCLRFMGRTEKLELRNGLLWHNWSPATAMYSEGELIRLHRSFGHPSVTALYNLLKRATPDDVNKETRDSIKELTKRCRTCAENASKPKRFKITVGTEDGKFNHYVAADIMYIEGKPLLHVVDESTHFSSASWLKKISSADVWKAFMRCWCHVYMGPPDFLRVDQGSQLISK